MKSMKNGIAEQKNAEIDALTSQVNKAQFRVNQLTTVVTSLTAKQANFAALLTDADSKKDAALANLNQAKTLVANVETLQRYSILVSQQTDKSLRNVRETSNHMAELIEQLIFSADVVEKLSGFVNRQKAANNVIPDALVAVLNQATSDANNAVALTLTALQSSYASAASVDQAGSVSALEARQAQQWLTLLTGTSADVQESLAQKRVNAVIKSVEKVLKALGKAQRENQNLMSQQNEKTQKYEAQLGQLNRPVTLEASASAVSADNASGDSVTSNDTETVSAQSRNEELSERVLSLQQEAIQARLAMDTARQEYRDSSETLNNLTRQADFYIAQLNIVIRSQQDNALYTLIQRGYQRAVERYQSALAASNMANTQLESAKSELARATASLNSLNAGLGAAKAAAFAA
ncbi:MULTISPECIES: hypothetical protein [Phytobacter]|jgi:chromosome segregation ATPase|uniref:Uncharacterized protein n=1 Tax=Phytobacter diazotrophicus TaxID=395631 RepID=A0ABM7VVP5_9ENTR|nr:MULTISPECIES: hypothetical protein [Phytobacter]MDU4152316.1 hypothetical protein [Enterobacteriaceae bacterium]MDU7378167.1 hypothetical protein [Enterobacteriaceae bacterium]MDV2900343.1 hypothetical protein [Phytobacter diazotrophicus]BBE77754.1 hypothetical protein MRY16398_28100 [Phytobacter sp. MRY16-398]BDD51123.1 hypothetical protein PDTA9734_26100 [Phytobacter diazotrophicus]